MNTSDYRLNDISKRVNQFGLTCLIFVHYLFTPSSSAHGFDPILITGYVKRVDEKNKPIQDEAEYYFLTAVSNEQTITQSQKPMSTEGTIYIQRLNKPSIAINYTTLKELPLLNFSGLPKFTITEYQQNNQIELTRMLHVNNYSVGCSLACFHWYALSDALLYADVQRLVLNSLETNIAEHQTDRVNVRYIAKDKKLNSIEWISKKYRSRCDYISGDTLTQGSFTCVVEDTNERGVKNKYFLHFERKYVTSEQIDRIIQKVFSMVPKGTVMMPGRDDVIAKRWDGSKFVEFVNPVVHKDASEQTFLPPTAKSHVPWLWIVAGIVVLFAGFFAWRIRKRTVAVCIAFLVVAGTSSASEGPYCGLFCVRAASVAIGHPVNFELIKTRDYLHGSPGSTSDDLIRALAVGGLKGMARTAMTVHELQSCESPVILHTKSPGAKVYHHWIVYLGSPGGNRVTVYDPNGGRIELNISELQSVWDGYGIVVASRETARRWPISPDWIAITLLLGGTYFLVRSRGSRWLAIGVALIGTIGAWHTLAPQGLLQSRRALGTTIAPHVEVRVPELSFEQFRESRDRGATVVDARPGEAYRSSHIPGSINVPVTASLPELHRVYDTLDADEPIVCYCATERCRWADIVASQLIHAGYRNVSVYRAGIMDWSERQLPLDVGD
jgi:rhodanese-related sulfurtransferase